MGMWDFAAQHELAFLSLICVCAIAINEVWRQIHTALDRHWDHVAAERRAEREAEGLRAKLDAETKQRDLAHQAQLFHERATYTCCDCKKTFPANPVCPTCCDANIDHQLQHTKHFFERELDTIWALADTGEAAVSPAGWSAAYKRVKESLEAAKLGRDSSNPTGDYEQRLLAISTVAKGLLTPYKGSSVALDDVRELRKRYDTLCAGLESETCQDRDDSRNLTCCLKNKKHYGNHLDPFSAPLLVRRG